MPGTFKLDQMQPIELLLCQNFSNFFTFILGAHSYYPRGPIMRKGKSFGGRVGPRLHELAVHASRRCGILPTLNQSITSHFLPQICNCIQKEISCPPQKNPIHPSFRLPFNSFPHNFPWRGRQAMRVLRCAPRIGKRNYSLQFMVAFGRFHHSPNAFYPFGIVPDAKELLLTDHW